MYMMKKNWTLEERRVMIEPCMRFKLVKYAHVTWRERTRSHYPFAKYRTGFIVFDSLPRRIWSVWVVKVFISEVALNAVEWPPAIPLFGGGKSQTMQSLGRPRLRFQLGWEFLIIIIVGTAFRRLILLKVVSFFLIWRRLVTLQSTVDNTHLELPVYQFTFT